MFVTVEVLACKFNGIVWLAVSGIAFDVKSDDFKFKFNAWFVIIGDFELVLVTPEVEHTNFTGLAVSFKGDSSRLDLEVIGIGLLNKWVLEGDIGIVGDTLVEMVV